jgi:ABC-2 type transport system permease protein
MSRLGLILTLAAKDWWLFWADRRAAVLCFVVPVILASAFGMIFHRPSAPTTVSRLPILLVPEGDGSFTKQITTELLGSERLAVTLATRADAEVAVANCRPAIAIVLGADFEEVRNWQPGRMVTRPEVVILHHATAGAERQLAEGIFTEVVMKQLARERFGGIPGASEAALTNPFRIESANVSAVANAQFNSYSHSFCGMTLQYLLFWGMESGLVFLRERQRGVWVRMRASPVPLSCVLTAKGLATAVIALLQVLVTFGFGYLVFGVTVTGSFIGFLLLVLAACALAAATGLLVAAIGGTEARARSVSILVILGISMVGGLWVPTFLLPDWVRDTALSLPTAWAMQGLGGVTWQGQGLRAVLPSVLAVTLFALVFLTIAVGRLKWSEHQIRQGTL